MTSRYAKPRTSYERVLGGRPVRQGEQISGLVNPAQSFVPGVLRGPWPPIVLTKVVSIGRRPIKSSTVTQAASVTVTAWV